MARVIVVLGAPGSSKAEQSTKLAAHLGTNLLSAGDLLRKEVAEGSEVGQQVSWFLQEKKAVPDNVVSQLVIAQLHKQESNTKGCILVGFPRNKAQAKELTSGGITPSHVVQLQVPRLNIAPGSEDENEQIQLRTLIEEVSVGLIEVRKLYWTTSHKIGGGRSRSAEVIQEDLRRIVEASPWHLMVLGAPGASKGKLVSRLVDQLGVVHVTKYSLMKAFPGHELTEEAEAAIQAGGGLKAVPAELLVKLLSMRLQQDDCKRCGWLLDGVPDDKRSVKLMTNLGFRPKVLVPYMSLANALESQIHIRYGVESHKKYHMKNDPPPAGVEVRINDANSASSVKKAYAEFDFVLQGVSSVVDRSDMVFVDGSQEHESQYKAIEEALYAHNANSEYAPFSPRREPTTVAEQELEGAATSIQAHFRGHQERKVPRTDRKFMIAGPPAAGKGTQCLKLVKTFGLTHISTGSLLRDHISRQTPIGVRVEQLVNNGELVSDSDVIALVKEAVEGAQCRKSGWLLDGIPRNAAQAQMLKAEGIVPSSFIILDTPTEVLVDRAVNRRIDPETGAIYHMKNKPPPEEIMERLQHRADDNEETVQASSAMYEANLGAVAEHFTECTVRIDGNRKPEVVFEDIRRVVEHTPWRLVVSGPGGSGKGKQIMMLLSKLGVTHVNLAHVVMQAAAAGSDAGMEVKQLKQARKPVPDELLVHLVVEHITNSSACKQKGWLLDGFPTTPVQTELFKKAQIKVDKVVLLDALDHQQADAAAQLAPLLGTSEAEVSETASEYRKLEASLLQCYKKKIIKLRHRGSVEGTNDAIMSELYGAVIKKEKLAKESTWIRPYRVDTEGNSYRLFITGPPGSGKGQVCERLHREMGVAHLSYASLHNHVQHLDQQLFAEAQSCISQTGAISPELTIQLLKKLSSEGDCAKYGWVLDGFPRNLAQALLLKESNLVFSRYINIEVPVEALVEKLCNSDSLSMTTEAGVKERTEAHDKETAQIMDLFKVQEMKIEGADDAEGAYALVLSNLSGQLIG